MKKLDKILVPFYGIKDGRHDFEFEINNTFFDEFGHPELKGGSFKVELRLNKSSSVSIISYTFNGEARVPCDLCLDLFDLPLEGEETLYVKSDQDFDDDANDEVFYLADSDNEVDLSQHVYDSICIRLPFKKVHPEDEDGETACDEEMLSRINNHQDSEMVEPETDPRWNDLKKFLEDNN